MIHMLDFYLSPKNKKNGQSWAESSVLGESISHPRCQRPKDFLLLGDGRGRRGGGCRLCDSGNTWCSGDRWLAGVAALTLSSCSELLSLCSSSSYLIFSLSLFIQCKWNTHTRRMCIDLCDLAEWLVSVQPRMFNSCNVLAHNNANDCLFLYALITNIKKTRSQGDGKLVVVMITLTLLYTLHCDVFCIECARRMSSARISFLTMQLGGWSFAHLFLPIYLRLPQLDSVMHNQSRSWVRMKEEVTVFRWQWQLSL